ncbi:MAG: GWxTD domain-containing protein [Gemmatimonadetes bacterium]|nr:GWxTD domain-containing protein [Gemmatimonadota bacterium]
MPSGRIHRYGGIWPSLLSAALLLALAAPARPACAQTSRAQEELRLGIEAAARGDTVGALARLDRAISLDPRLAEAHFQQGQIYSTRASARSTQYEDRMKAQTALEEALRHDPDNPLYLLELGKLMLKQQIRLDAQRVLKRALAVAARADAATLAEVHFQLGVLRETQWLRFRYRHNLPMYITQVDAGRSFADPGYVWRLLDNSIYPGENQGELEREQMLEQFRAALAANPAHAGAAAHLLAYLYDEGQTEEYVAQARQFVRARSTSPLAYLALGLGLHRLAREDEAAGAFQYALSLMVEGERRQFEHIGRILSKDVEKQYIQLSEAGQAEYQQRFWGQSDPLFLTPANEFWLEYMARLAYADIRFGLPEYGVRGWETDRGVIYLRYGPPVRKATFGPSVSNPGDFEAWGRITTVWTYGEKGPVFVFRQNPGYRNATFANDFRFYAEDYRVRQPVQLATPSIPERHPLPMQVARFRGERGQMEVEIHAALPLDKLMEKAPVARGEIESGLFVQDERAREIERLVRKDVVDFQTEAGTRLESWRIALPADRERQFLVGVEAREPLTWHAAVGRAVVPARQFPAGRLAVSDPLLADLVEPRVAEPQARPDFRIVPNPAMSYAAERPVALYFEIYNLLPDPEHYAAYELELIVTVKEIHRTGPALKKLLGELADKWGLTPEGSQSVQLRFEKQARVLARDLIPEYFQVQLPDAPPGRYALRLLIRDRNAGREAAVEREFRIHEQEARP